MQCTQRARAEIGLELRQAEQRREPEAVGREPHDRGGRIVEPVGDERLLPISEARADRFEVG